MVSVAVIKHRHVKMCFVGKRFISPYNSQVILKDWRWSGKKLKVGTWRNNWSRSHGGGLLTDLILLNLFSYTTWNNFPGVIPQYLHTQTINWENALQTCLQAVRWMHFFFQLRFWFPDNCSLWLTMHQPAHFLYIYVLFCCCYSLSWCLVFKVVSLF